MPYADLVKQRNAVAAWSVANKPKVQRYTYKSTLMRKYGLSIEQYDSMVLASTGTCTICDRKFAPTHLEQCVVDHCHATKKVRGLLCFACNAALGYLRDNSTIIMKAYEYICKSSEQ